MADSKTTSEHGTKMEVLSVDGIKDETGVEEGNADPAVEAKNPAKSKKSFRFWAIMIALGCAALLTALEATITSTALPTIADKMGGADRYVWLINGYLLSTSVLPCASLTCAILKRWC
jgi:hypothetical protein